MGETRPARSVRLICGLLAAHDALLARTAARLEASYGPIDDRSGIIPFTFTTYYAAEMGPGLLRQFLSFRDRVDPARLPDIKLAAIALEAELSAAADGVLHRRVNIDPGYVAPDKLVLASTKDFPHRIYLRDGIYAEVTLRFSKSGVQTFDWTYADFKTTAYQEFLLAVRKRLLAEGPDHSPPAARTPPGRG